MENAKHSNRYIVHLFNYLEIYTGRASGRRRDILGKVDCRGMSKPLLEGSSGKPTGEGENPPPSLQRAW